MLTANRGRHEATPAPRRPGAVVVPVVLLVVGAGSAAGLAGAGRAGTTHLAALDLTGAAAVAGADLARPGTRPAVLERASRSRRPVVPGPPSAPVTVRPAAVRASALRAEKASPAHAVALRAGALRAAAQDRVVRPADGPVTSPFGTRWGRLHAGIDFGAPYGSPVRAVAAGTVVEAGFDSGGYGNFVHVRHADGTVTSYNHMSKVLRPVGTVGAGDVVGLIGSTGHSTGPHLHFEVRVDDVPVDPRPWLAEHGLVV